METVSLPKPPANVCGVELPEYAMTCRLLDALRPYRDLPDVAREFAGLKRDRNWQLSQMPKARG